MIDRILGSTKYITIIEILLILSTFLFLGVNTYWYFEKPIYQEITSNKDLGQIESGKSILMSRYVCSNKQLTMSAKRIFVREDGLTFPVQSINLDSGLCGDVNFPVYIPVYLPNGNYKYIMILNYDLNPLKRVTQTLTPVKFEVK